MRVALVHDYLSQDGGAERVLKAMHEIWPEAPIHALFYDREKISDFASAEIRQSFLSRLPRCLKNYRWYLPLMPLATEKYNLSDFDVVVSSSSAFSKGVIVRPDALHFCYCHTPTRYLWTETHEYLEDLRYGFLLKIFLSKIIHRLRLWDRMSADRVDFFIANSDTVRNRISKYYRKDSDVLYPPVRVADFAVAKTGNFFLTGGRLVPYKKFDLVVEAFNRLGWQLKIFGTGPEQKRLSSMSKPNIQFLGAISEQEKSHWMSRAKAFIHPQLEDFGITVVESMAAGRPVIAYEAGGATETVIPGETGVFFNRQHWHSLLDVLLKFDAEKWSPEKIRERAGKYDIVDFKRKLREYVEKRYEEAKEINARRRLAAKV